MPELLEDPALAGIEIGSEQWFEAQRTIIASRPLVRETYDRWYSDMLRDVRSAPDFQDTRVLEIGSGAGYVKNVDPSVITSDVVGGHADMIVDAQNLPFQDASLRGILLTHVFHHIPDVTKFLAEAMRVLVPGGVVTMIDVAHTPLSRLIFGRFHPEKYDHNVTEWELDTSGTYGGANQALSWMVFVRDRALFESRFPSLTIECIEYLPWLGYMLSGGGTRRDLIPASLVPAVRALDSVFTTLNPLCALHWHIRLRKSTA